MKHFCFALLTSFCIFCIRSVVAQEQNAETFPVDPLFERGFRINGAKHGDSKRIVDANGEDAPNGEPIWDIAQWHSKGLLDKTEIDGSRLKLYDDFKSLTIDRKTGAFIMTVHGGKEYADRLDAEFKNPWVHLLLSQGDSMKTPMLHTLEKLVVELEFELTGFKSVLKNPPKSHAAQFQLFLYLRGIDAKNPGQYKSFTWFGISMFDCRKDFTDDYAARDFAVQNGLFIYTIGTKHTLKQKIEIDKRLKIEVDILPHVRKALEAGHAQGFMNETRYEDTLFDGMNIGWEIPGVFDCEITVHQFKITPFPKKN